MQPPNVKELVFIVMPKNVLSIFNTFKAATLTFS